MNGPFVFDVDGWTVDQSARSLSNGVQTVRLSPRALGVLTKLADTPMKVVDRDTLMDTVWPGVFVGDESLTQAVSELRRAFGPSGRRLIETVPKRGYLLSAPVTSADALPTSGTPDAQVFDLTAYRLCHEARATMARGGRHVVASCLSLTGQAVAVAPDFAFARAEHAIALGYGWLYKREDSDAAEKALAHAEAAVRLRADLATGHVAKAFALGALGRSEDAIQALNAAFAHDLNDHDSHFIGARMMFVLRDYPAAAALAERAAQLRPDDCWSLYFGARAASAFDPARSRRNSAACLRRIQDHLAIDADEPRARNLLGPLLATLGRAEEARAAIASQQDAGSTLQIYDAIGHAMLGDDRMALSTIDCLVERGWRHGEWLAAEPAFAGLHDDREFRHTLSMTTGQ
ncbi:MAG: transcriptional regulator [Pseudomonadota bacterium]